MEKITHHIKKTVLFLFGIFLVVWGYKANAANNNEKAQDNTTKKENKEKSSLFGTIEVNTTKPDTTNDKTINQTVIESGNQAEEASGTQ